MTGGKGIAATARRRAETREKVVATIASWAKAAGLTSWHNYTAIRAEFPNVPPCDRWRGGLMNNVIGINDPAARLEAERQRLELQAADYRDGIARCREAGVADSDLSFLSKILGNIERDIVTMDECIREARSRE